MRYILGTPTTRPSGLAVATALEEVGYPVTVLRATPRVQRRPPLRRHHPGRETLNVLVIDRDLEGAGVAANIWRTLRVRDDSAPSRLSMRRRLERTALQAYASQAAGAPTRNCSLPYRSDEDAALLAFPASTDAASSRSDRTCPTPISTMRGGLCGPCTTAASRTVR